MYGKHALHLGASDMLKDFRQHLDGRGDFSSRKNDPLKGENFRQHIHLPLWKVAV